MQLRISDAKTASARRLVVICVISIAGKLYLAQVLGIPFFFFSTITYNNWSETGSVCICMHACLHTYIFHGSAGPATIKVNSGKFYFRTNMTA